MWLKDLVKIKFKLCVFKYILDISSCENFEIAYGLIGFGVRVSIIGNSVLSTSPYSSEDPTITILQEGFISKIESRIFKKIALLFRKIFDGYFQL